MLPASYPLIPTTCLPMFLIAGLGNPGEQFKNTRHNIGRETVQSFHKKMGFREFRFEKRWNALVSEGTADKTKVALLLPETFVNKSGGTVARASRFFKVKPDRIYVVHDDADIALGSAKLSFAKRSAGHKGVKSIIRALKTDEFWRFRIGIAGKRDIPAEKIVLRKFMPQKTKIAKKIIKKTIEALGIALMEGPERAMNEYNR